jgi:glutamine---fructose-6-phosphate transaminase (isomerizing)
MCGIFGFIATNGSTCDAATVRDSLALLFKLSEPRGREASGLVISTGGEANVFKRGLAPSKMLARDDYKKFLSDTLGKMVVGPDGKLGRPLTAFGHCRLVTNGAETLSDNNQPILVDHSIGLHNGIIANEDALWRNYGDIARQSHVDSEVIFRLIDRHVSEGDDIHAAVARTFDEIVGTASIAFIRDDMNGLMLATNTGSLYVASIKGSGIFVFSSEQFILSEFLKSNTLNADSHGALVEQLKPGSGCFVDFDDVAANRFDLVADAQTKLQCKTGRISFVDRSHSINEIKRCSKCVTPASYPFIEFDADGVCNKCREYVSQKPIGGDSLEQELAKYRSKDGSPDCIVAFSGGRDSSYGLHLIKNKLGMNPVAFTYDWGMVTDIARRNQARMCGQLGVEHILRAADIPAKRRNIRKNIQAWLARPKLGMIPLFMAGDKYFYHYARELRKETGIKLVIFCAGNELERTDFKSGFAGVQETTGHRNRLFGFSLANKVGLASWYALQYLLNPRYFNESFFDTMGAFFQTFVAKDDFLYLFDYLKWDEEEINKTLIGEYGWEGAADSDNTWRIGDGYTSFINYIYHTVAGFSEYDTFRSNQIREGLITREQALELLAQDNEPKLDVLYDFAKHTGFNLEEVLTRINSINKLY